MKKKGKKKPQDKKRERKRREEEGGPPARHKKSPPPVPWVSVATRSTRDALRAVNLSRGEKHESTFRFEGRARSL